jgi:major type 1 subunit fimbrin (pilin)
MKHKLLSAFVLAATAMVAQVASAADGTITFTGSITDTTCSINGGATGSFAVVLPQVSTSSMAGVNVTSGRTPFKIALTGCTVQAGKVHAYFESGAAVDTVTGNLKNTGAAQGVQIRLLNADESKINVGNADAAQNSQVADLVAGAATLPYFAEYVRTGDITAGSVNSAVMYSIVYQ